MDSTQRSQIKAQVDDLRVQLKTWENDFGKDHQGRKPGRDDIKRNPDIAQKYKTFQRLRDTLDGKIPPPQPKEHSRKRKSPEQSSQTPPKRSRFLETPSRTQTYSHMIDTAVTPNRKLFSPVVPTSIGPTPQRDGIVLGLFDALPFKNVDETPTKALGKSDIYKTKVAGTVHVTPGKLNACFSLESAAKLGRTPMSASKRNILNEFMTPLKKHDGKLGCKTPTSSVSKLQFATPAFLRRAPMPSVDENGEFVSPEPVRLPRKLLTRGLSSVVADLRKLQEEEHDDDMDALREIESGGPQLNKAVAAIPRPNAQPRAKDDEILVDDSQVRSLPLGGFDDENAFDSQPENEGLARDGQPLRVYKKKGQKRTTRRVNMKPTRTKRPVKALGEGAADNEGEDMVPDTQLGASKQAQDEDEDNLATNLSGSEFDVSDAEDDDQPKKKTAKKGGKAAAKKAAKEPAKMEGTVKKAARKVNEMTHANFKRLKLRNNGAKGGAGINSRFRRRR